MIQEKQKYEVGHKTVSQLLSNFQQGDILIPEIQRPFVWKATQVRDLIDSLYKGYPVGYIVTSKSSNVRLKNGQRSGGETMIIDGQQRITALATALLSVETTDADYNKRVIRIAFSPKTKRFVVPDASTVKDKTFIGDISIFFRDDVRMGKIKRDYLANNPDMDEDELADILDSVVALKGREIGMLELSKNLEMDIVTEIFRRINQEGTQLKEADFVMSKIAANEAHGGNLLRKVIDHFSELVAKPERYEAIATNDTEFAASPYLSKIAWLRNENDDIYDPSYEDIVRVVLTYKFKRGKMGQLVQLLDGRNFATRTDEAAIIDDTYSKLTDGICDFIKENNFKKFVMVVSSAGFCRGRLIRSMGAMNFCYALYLHLYKTGYPQAKLQSAIRRWLVLSLLTGRYSSGAETRYETDINRICELGMDEYLAQTEQMELSDIFWNEKLVSNLRTSGTTSTAFNVFLAAQCKVNAKGFLSTDITVRNMVEEKGDVHHIFPKQYLKEHGFTQTMYNQVANYAYVQTEINQAISDKAPNEYFAYVFNAQCNGEVERFGGINNLVILKANMVENCIPEGLETMTAANYADFCNKRRQLMSETIRQYYLSL